MLEEVQNKKTVEPKAEKKKQEQVQKTQEASDMNIEGIINNVAGLKLELDKRLEWLEKQMLDKYKNFQTLQEAVTIENNKL